MPTERPPPGIILEFFDVTWRYGHCTLMIQLQRSESFFQRFSLVTYSESAAVFGTHVVCASAHVWSLPGGLLPSQLRRRSIVFRVLFQQTNKQTNSSSILLGKGGTLFPSGITTSVSGNKVDAHASHFKYFVRTGPLWYSCWCPTTIDAQKAGSIACFLVCMLGPFCHTECCGMFPCKIRKLLFESAKSNLFQNINKNLPEAKTWIYYYLCFKIKNLLMRIKFSIKVL